MITTPVIAPMDVSGAGMGYYARASVALHAGIKNASRIRIIASMVVRMTTGAQSVFRSAVEAAILGNVTTLAFALLDVSKIDMDQRAAKHVSQHALIVFVINKLEIAQNAPNKSRVYYVEPPVSTCSKTFHHTKQPVKCV